MHGTRGATDAATGTGTTGMSAALLLIADSRLPAGGHAHSGGAEEAVHVGAITGPEDLARFRRGGLATTGLVTAALSAAACHLAATGTAGLWRELDAEADARTPSPAMRTASRTQGRLLVRTARRIWPSVVLDGLAAALPGGAHHAVALGVAADAAGCPLRDAALAAAYNTITGPATAAVRLLGLDPVTVHRLLADLAPELDGTAKAAVAAVNDAQVDETVASPEPIASLTPALAGDRTISTHLTALRDFDTREGSRREDAAPGSVADGGSGDHVIRYDWAALPSCGAPALDLLAEGHLRREVRLFVS